MSTSRHHNETAAQLLLVSPCFFLSPPRLFIMGCREVWCSPTEREKQKSEQVAQALLPTNWHREIVPSAGMGACTCQALLVCHGNSGCNKDRCCSGSEQEAAFIRRLFWHPVPHTLQSITVKCLITDVVIKPEELCLYIFSFSLPGITKCFIKPPIMLIFELGMPISSKMTSLQGLPS